MGLGSPALGETSLGGEPINQFPVKVRNDAVKGQESVTVVRFQFYFPVDAERYRPVDGEVAAVLSLNPTVSAPPGVEVETSTRCLSMPLRFLEGGVIKSVNGGVLSCEVTTVVPPSFPGDSLQVSLAFPALNLFYRLTNQIDPSAPVAEARIDYQLWASAAALQTAVEERESAKRAELARIKAEEEADRAEKRKRAWGWGKILLGVLGGGIGIVLLWTALEGALPHWLKPDHVVTVRRGTRASIAVASLKTKAIVGLGPGTILETSWASSLGGKRQRIKVETMVDEPLKRSTLDPIAALESARSEIERGVTVQLVGKLIVSAGASIRRGRYFVRSPAVGAVQIRVQ